MFVNMSPLKTKGKCNHKIMLLGHGQVLTCPMWNFENPCITLNDF